jgi:hypothetical protein
MSSVTLVPLWLTSREISSMGTPASESSETNECLSSRGVQSADSMPDTLAKARLKGVDAAFG